MLSPEERFTARVTDYAKSRPSYPDGLIPLLIKKYGLSNQSVVADIGSGTGLLSESFLKNGNTVYGVEPNDVMREAGERYLMDYDNFVSVPGSAERTQLIEDCCDFVVAGQAFHWFNRALARPEFRRILKPKGWVMLAWNILNPADKGLSLEYEQLFQCHGVNYQGGGYHLVSQEILKNFFGSYEFAILPNPKIFDFEGFQSRVFSSSYAPLPGDSGYEEMKIDALQLFERYQKKGKIELIYQTRLYLGQLL
jgi:SAM-dependent methyltransferase